MLYRCHCVCKTWCETTDRKSKQQQQQQQKYILLGVTAAAAVTVVVVVVAVIFACPLFCSYIPTSVHLFIHNFSVYKE